MSWCNAFFSAFISTFFFSSFEFFLSSATVETITSRRPLRDWQTLTSAGEEFSLGFFRPGESRNRYVAIWYNKLATEKQTVVWVANRDTPLTDSNGVFAFQDDGNLAVLDGRGTVVWKTNISTNSTSLDAILLDTGNLVLRDGGTTVWQSFDNPFDTLLPGMKIGVNRLLISREEDNNLGSGIYSFGADPRGQNQLFIGSSWKKPNWQSGIWNGSYFEEIPEANENLLFYFIKNRRGDEVRYTYSSFYNHTRLVMNASGKLQFWMWYEFAGQWLLRWSTSRHGCHCGVNSICYSKILPLCSCCWGLNGVSGELESWVP